MTDRKHNNRSSGVPAGVEVRHIPGRSEKYAAGSDGRIYCFSTARRSAKSAYPFALNEFIASTGYPSVGLIENGKRMSHAVHRLVCAAFSGPPPFKDAIVRHLDGTRDNNLPANLAWGSYADNEADKRRHGRTACGERHGNVKLTEEAVRIIRASIPFGLWNTRDAATVFGVDISTIRHIADGRSWRGIEPVKANIDRLEEADSKEPEHA